MIEIKNWKTQKVIHSGDFNSTKECLEDGFKKGICFNYAQLNYAKLNYAKLNGAKLNGAKLNGAKLNGAKLNDAKLNDAQLNDAELNGAQLNNAQLNYAELNKAQLNDAELNKAQLNGAELNKAQLNGAELNNAQLNYCIGNMNDICSMQLKMYKVVFTRDIIAIGCKQYSIEEWKSFDDDQILKMDGKRALKFWKKWKDHIFATIDLTFKIK